MKAIIKREFRNYLKNPIFWIGVILVFVGVYQSTAPYLEIRYFQSEDEITKRREGTSMGDMDVMHGNVPSTKEEQLRLGYDEIKKTFIENFDMSIQEAEAAIRKMEEGNLSLSEIPDYLEQNYGFFSNGKYLFKEHEYRKGTAEEVNAYIDAKLKEHPFSYYFSRKFADFAGLFLGFFASVLLAFLFVRDTKRDTYELLHTKPIRAKAYLCGKVAGGFLTMVAVLGILTLAFGMICGFYAHKEGFPVGFADMVWSSVLYVVPNLMMITSVYAGIAILFKNPLPAIPLLLLYIVYSNMGGKDADGIYGYYGRPLAIMVRFPGNFFDTTPPPYVQINQMFLLVASAFLILFAVRIWKRRRMY